MFICSQSRIVLWIDSTLLSSIMLYLISMLDIMSWNICISLLRFVGSFLLERVSSIRWHFSPSGALNSTPFFETPRTAITFSTSIDPHDGNATPFLAADENAFSWLLIKSLSLEVDDRLPFFFHVPQQFLDSMFLCS